MITLEDFAKVDIRAGEIVSAQINEKARKPAYALQIDFGTEIGIKASSAQICDNYTADQLIGTKVLAIVNLPPRKVAGFNSEVLVLAVVCSENGTVLVRPDKSVRSGERLA